jgi:uncharacterized protein with HEPN domain
MAGRSLVPRLSDMVQACERIRTLLNDMPLEAFEADWQKQWLVERGLEIIPEASRHLTDELKARHPNIPWVKVAGIDNVLRHNYEHVAPDILSLNPTSPSLKQSAAASWHSNARSHHMSRVKSKPGIAQPFVLPVPLRHVSKAMP